MGYSFNSFTFLAITLLFISSSHQQYTTFISDDGCEVKIPFVQSCSLGIIDDSAKSDSKLLELKQLLLEIVHGSSIYPEPRHDLQSDSGQTRSSMNLMEAGSMEESCWDKMSTCLSENQNVRSGNIELSQALQEQTLNVETFKSRIEVADNQTFNCVTRLHELEEVVAVQNEKDDIIEGLQKVLLELEQSVVEMQLQHQAETSQLRKSLSHQRRMVSRRDNTIDILRHQLSDARAEKTELDADECAKMLESWRLETNILQNEAVVQDQQVEYRESKQEVLDLQPVIEEPIVPGNMALVEKPSAILTQIISPKPDLELEARKPEDQTVRPIVEVSQIKCEPDDTSQACELLPFITSTVTRRCSFTRAASADYSWSLMSYANLQEKVNDPLILPPNPNACLDEYYYLDFSSLVVGQSATLTSGFVAENNQPQCFTFWYYLVYEFNHGKIHIDVTFANTDVVIWEEHTKGTSRWAKAYFNIPASISTKGFVIRLTAEGNGPGFISLNSVTLTQGVCVEV